MSADQLGLIVLVILFAAGFAFRRWYIRQAKTYKISEQQQNGWQLIIYDHNPRTENSTIELRCIAPGNQSDHDCRFGMELIQKKREFLKLPFFDYPQLKFHAREEGRELHFFVEKRSLLLMLRNEGLSLYRFRFYVHIDDQQLVKSPEFAFSPKFLIYRPDTGKYN